MGAPTWIYSTLIDHNKILALGLLFQFLHRWAERKVGGLLKCKIWRAVNKLPDVGSGQEMFVVGKCTFGNKGVKEVWQERNDRMGSWDEVLKFLQTSLCFNIAFHSDGVGSSFYKILGLFQSTRGHNNFVAMCIKVVNDGSHHLA